MASAWTFQIAPAVLASTVGPRRARLALALVLQCSAMAGIEPRLAHAQSNPVQAFGLPPPDSARLSDARMVVLTAFRIAPIIPAADASIPLLDAGGARLGPVLDDGQFCELAAAGAGVIGGASYRVAGTARAPQVNCRRYFSRLARKMPVAAGALGRSVFARIDSPHGLGARDFRLVPWRSVATGAFALGTALYMPTLRGLAIEPGRAHDGFVFVADDLADAPRDRVAMVIGDGVFDLGDTRRAAMRVHDLALIEALTALHRVPP